MRLSLPKILRFAKSPDASLKDGEAAPGNGNTAHQWNLPAVLIAAVVVMVVCVLDFFHASSLLRVELMTYDARVEMAARHPSLHQFNATNLALVEIGDESIDAINNGSLGFSYGLYWPRSVYAWTLQELEQLQVKTAGFDVLFSGLRPADPLPTNDAEFANGPVPTPDNFFADTLNKAGNVILAAQQGVLPAAHFRNQAADLGNIDTERDPDGILRRDRIYQDYRVWHPWINQLAATYDFDLDATIVGTTNISFVRKRGREPIIFPTDKDGFIETRMITSNVPPDAPRFEPFTMRRVWSMGIVLAASELKLDLDNADVQLQNHRVIFHGANGLVRSMPIESDGSFYINWELEMDNPGIIKGSLEEMLMRRLDLTVGQPETNNWKGRLVMVGSTATGNELSDLGATPLDGSTHLVTKHLNVANSIIANRFITTSPPALRWLLIAIMGALAAWITSAVARPLTGSALMAGVVVLYTGLAFWLYLRFRFWVPIFLPLVCSGIVTHLVALTYRVRAEQSEKKRVKSVFSKMLAPEVVDTLLSGPVALGGERRELTIYFADVRGFTSLTDVTQARAAEYVQSHKLSPEEAKKYHDRLAKETLETVSGYLGTIAEVIKKHNGTLDKYIGDCVMAFWGGPVSNPMHARDAVRSAVDAQRAVLALNLRREADNKRITAENDAAVAEGRPVQSLLPLLSMGTGINSGPTIMGLMGSDSHGLNFTVFGREVNLASRLEGLSGHSRIIISEATYLELRRDDPALADLCVERPPADVKGFRHAVKIYEVLWRPPDAPEDPKALEALVVGTSAETGLFVR